MVSRCYLHHQIIPLCRDRGALWTDCELWCSVISLNIEMESRLWWSSFTSKNSGYSLSVPVIPFRFKPCAGTRIIVIAGGFKNKKYNSGYSRWFWPLTPKELGTQTFKNGGFTDNHDVSKKIGAYFGAYFGTYQFFAEVQAQKLCLN